MTAKKTVLIIGVSSFVGSNLAYYLKDHYRVVGTYFHNPVNIPGVFALPCDVTRRELVEKIMKILRPNIVIYAVGASSISDAHDFPKAIDRLYTVGILNTVTMSERLGAKFCLISSGYVFAGDDVTYTESDTPMPVTVYGTKVSASEFYIQKTCLNYMILRCSPFYGRGINPYSINWFEWVERKYAEGKNFSCDSIITTGFLDISYLGQVLHQCLEMGVVNRLFQLSSSDHGTVYDFAKTYAKVFNLNQDLVQKGSWRFPSDFHSSQGPNQFYRLDTSNIEDFLSSKMLSIEEHLKSTYSRWAKDSKVNPSKKKSVGISYI